VLALASLGFFPGCLPPGDRVGGPPVPTPTPPPPASFWENAGGEYSHEPGCSDDGIDPISTIIITLEQNAADATGLTLAYFQEAGLTSGPGPFTTLQFYEDFGNCVQGEISQGTNDGFEFCGEQGLCAEARWHVRCNTLSQAVVAGFWSSCTPHWDAAIPSCHYVPVEFNGPGSWQGSGFEAARDWLWWQLTQESGAPMDFVGPVNFNNVVGQLQCNGDITSLSDGKVNVVFTDLDY
jgi:hypothetical protein